MMTFLFKNNNANTHTYIDTRLLRANYKCSGNRFIAMQSGSTLCLHNVDYNEIETILTEEEINILCNHKGEDITEIIAKLESSENAVLLQKVQEEEKEFIRKTYDITKGDLNKILSRQQYELIDRNMVDSIHENVKEFGYYVAEGLNLIDVNDKVKNFYYSDYFNFARLGRDTLNTSPFCHELKDGRILVLASKMGCGLNCHL